ncbi:MAG: FtsX-like permease family protein [Acidobacteria bacterium]|nr:FtsX-like permease family protein [Acidobacteriota bacterium]
MGKGIRQLSNGPWQEIIGVVADIKSSSLEEQPLGEIYRMLDKEPPSSMYLAVRTRTRSSGRLVGAAVRGSEPGVAFGEFETMHDRIWSAGAKRRFHTSIVSSFASLSLVLDMVGLFGLAMHWVRTRTPEIGLRMALGATGPQVFALVLEQALRPLIAGGILGLGLSWVVTKTIAGFVYEIPANDPLPLVAAPTLLLIAGVPAVLVPCWKATQVDPAVSLRAESTE